MNHRREVDPSERGAAVLDEHDRLKPTDDPTPAAADTAPVPTAVAKVAPIVPAESSEPTTTERCDALPADVVTDELRSACVGHDRAVAFARRLDASGERWERALQHAVEDNDNVAAAVAAATHLGAVPAVRDVAVAKVASTKAAVDQQLGAAIDRMLGHVAGQGQSIEVGALEYRHDLSIYRRYLRDNPTVASAFTPPPTGPLDVEVGELRDDVVARIATFDAQVNAISTDRGRGSLFDTLRALCSMRDVLAELRELAGDVNRAIETANAERRAAAVPWHMFPDSVGRPL